MSKGKTIGIIVSIFIIIGIIIGIIVSVVIFHDLGLRKTIEAGSFYNAASIAGPGEEEFDDPLDLMPRTYFKVTWVVISGPNIDLFIFYDYSALNCWNGSTTAPPSYNASRYFNKSSGEMSGSLETDELRIFVFSNVNGTSTSIVKITVESYKSGIPGFELQITLNTICSVIIISALYKKFNRQRPV